MESCTLLNKQIGKVDKLSGSYILYLMPTVPYDWYYVQKAWELLNITALRLWTA